mgnify:CR=1 FL=1
MWDKIWEFLNNHVQHATFETIILFLAISVGIAIFVTLFFFFIKINKESKKKGEEIKKTQRKSGKSLISLLRKKKNTTY